MTQHFRNRFGPAVQPDRFGRPEGVEPTRLFMLPVAMQAEGLRLLEEGGMKRADICRRVQLPLSEVTRLIESTHPLHRRTVNESGGEIA